MEQDLSHFLKPYNDDLGEIDTSLADSHNEEANSYARNEPPLQQNPLAPKEEKEALTGIPYLDKKIQEGTLSSYDAYLANKYLGVNFTNLNVKAKVQGDLKHTNLTQTTKDLGLMLNALQNSEEVLKRSELAGTWNGALTALNQKTGGFIGLGDERAKLHAASLQTAYAAADAMNNGKATNESRKEAKETFGLGFRSQKELVARTAQAREAMLNRIDTLLDDLEAKGGSLGLDKTMIAKIREQKRKQDFLNYDLYQKHNGKFRFSDYENSPYENFRLQRNKQNKEFQRAKQ